MDHAAGGKYRSLQHDQLGELLSAASLHHCYLDVLIHRLKVTSHTQPFNGPLSRTTRVSQYQKSKTNLDFTEARDSEWQWHPQGYMRLHLAPDR